MFSEILKSMHCVSLRFKDNFIEILNSPLNKYQICKSK